jgi:integrase
VTFPASGRRKDKFHCLRKTFGTRAAMAGVDQKALMALMRHKSYSTTERYYLDAEALMAQAVEKIEVAPAIREVAG